MYLYICAYVHRYVYVCTHIHTHILLPIFSESNHLNTANGFLVTLKMSAPVL